MKKIIYLLVLFSSILPLQSYPKSLVEGWNVSTQRYLPGSRIQWEPLEKLPFSEKNQALDYSSGLVFLSYEKKIELTPSEIDELGRDLLSLHIPFLASYYEVYWNEALVRSCGKLSNNKIVEGCIRRHLVIPLSERELIQGENTIHIVTAAEEGHNIGIWASNNDEIINLDKLSSHLYMLSERVTLMLGFLYFFMGLYHALFYFKRREESYNLYYSLFSLFLAIYIYSRSNSVFETFGEGMMLKRTEFVVVYFIPAFLIFFLERFFLGKLSLISKLYFAFVSTIGLATIFFPSNYLNQFLKIWQFSALYVVIHSIIVCGIAFRRKSPDVKRLLLGILALVVAGSWDVMGAMGLFGLENLGLMRYGFFIFVSGIAFILANRFLRIHKEVETLNLELEKKVEERTEKLKESLVEIQSLKVQQDGDYFLTSLLINPLSRNSIQKNSSNFDIQFFSKQKKEFEFRGRKMEIGGDINIVDQVNLRGREYIVFVNGDAMGKSIQGAGGALVLGVIFHSVVVRTNQRKDASSRGPENWLKECYLELQTVFETFDGSMLISVVMGLVDAETGYMFYINAEHPWTVLYRDGKAGFMESSLELRKIGTMGLSSEFRIKSIQLEAGDVIYVGSDGRDDLLLGYSPEGDRIINEDENLFLACIEEGNGELIPTINCILSKGELTDDISLIRIEFSPDSEELESRNIALRERLNHLYDTAKEALKEKDYLASSVNFGLIADGYPDNLESYYLASYSYKKKRDYQEALNYGERLYLRDQNHLKNLLNLADIHRYIGNVQRSSLLLQRIDELSPNDPIANKIRESLDKALQARMVESYTERSL